MGGQEKGKQCAEAPFELDVDMNTDDFECDYDMNEDPGPDFESARGQKRSVSNKKTFSPFVCSLAIGVGAITIPPSPLSLCISTEKCYTRDRQLLHLSFRFPRFSSLFRLLWPPEPLHAKSFLLQLIHHVLGKQSCSILLY
jgi:hypothetical protein